MQNTYPPPLRPDVLYGRPLTPLTRMYVCLSAYFSRENSAVHKSVYRLPKHGQTNHTFALVFVVILWVIIRGGSHNFFPINVQGHWLFRGDMGEGHHTFRNIIRKFSPPQGHMLHKQIQDMNRNANLNQTNFYLLRLISSALVPSVFISHLAS